MLIHKQKTETRMHEKVCVTAFYYAPAIRRIVKRAYSVTTVCLSVSVCIQDGINDLRLSFSGVSNLCKFFQAGAAVSVGHIST